MNNILLVEDEISLKQGLEFLLQAAGYHIVSAIDAEQAIQKMNEREFDLIITDLVLPKGDGRTVINTVRKKIPTIPIICMTAYIDNDIAREVKPMVGENLLEKPVELNQLLNTIKSLLR
ncbi:response regulator [candidate division KSB1 bacterium]|nr:response regulator [candidate division KSB1 bacterium]